MRQCLWVLMLMMIPSATIRTGHGAPMEDRDPVDLANEELLRCGMGRFIQLHGVWSRTLRLGLEQNMRDYLHTYATAIQNWRRYPNFLGLSYGDDMNTLGDWESGSYDAPQSDKNFQNRMKFWIAEFGKLHPELNVYCFAPQR